MATRPGAGTSVIALVHFFLCPCHTSAPRLNRRASRRGRRKPPPLATGTVARIHENNPAVTTRRPAEPPAAAWRLVVFMLPQVARCGLGVFISRAGSVSDGLAIRR